jgi:hypothetical protein
MTSEQNQRIGTGGQAIQAGRDVVIQQALSPEAMAEIMIATANKMSIYRSDALRVVEERLEDFRKDILSSFTRTYNPGNPEAFRDPDFQFLLGDAQNAYARSGDQAVKGTLVDIITRRSLQTGRSRTAVTLNDAATRAPVLTINEFSALSLGYLLRHTINNGIRTFPAFCHYIASQLMPFVPDITNEASSYWHIEAQSCGIVEMGVIDLLSIFRRTYAGVLGKGISRQTLETSLPEGKKNALDNFLVPCLHDTSKLQPKFAVRPQEFLDLTRQTGLDSQLTTNVWTAFENTVPPKPDMIALIKPYVQDIERLFSAWDETPMEHLRLTSVGLAIGHANAVRVIGFDAPLNVWIK